jgi:hypothetical protein
VTRPDFENHFGYGPAIAVAGVVFALWYILYGCHQAATEFKERLRQLSGQPVEFKLCKQMHLHLGPVYSDEAQVVQVFLFVYL